jgi:hypothetical protein
MTVGGTTAEEIGREAYKTEAVKTRSFRALFIGLSLL